MLDVFVYTDQTLTLTEAEEADLIVRAQAADDEATMTLVTAYGRALRAAVRNFGAGATDGHSAGNHDLDLADLQSTALVGFLTLIAEHDPEQSPRLAGRVAAYLTRFLSEEFAAVAAFTVPTRTLRRFYGILRAYDGSASLAEEHAHEHGMTRETFLDVLAAVRGTGSLDAVTADGDSPEVYATPVYTTTPVVDVEDRILTDVAFGAVDDEEERICRLSYGFTEYDPQPDAEIAHRMGLTRPTVQRKRGKALGKMRKALGVTSA